MPVYWRRGFGIAAVAATFLSLTVTSGGAVTAAAQPTPKRSVAFMLGETEVQPLPAEPGDSAPPENGDGSAYTPVPENTEGALEGNVTGGGEPIPPDAPMFASEAERNQWPAVLRDLYEQGTITKEQADTWAKEAGFSESPIREPGPRSEPAAGITALPNSKTLSITHRPQSNSWRCGPAAAQMILTGSGVGKQISAYNSDHTRSQYRLGTSTYLDTTSSAGTPWGQHRMKIGLNRWVHGSSDGGSTRRWIEIVQPDFHRFRAAAQESIGDSNRSMAVNTIERANGPHYNGHPRSQTIGHWVVNYAYDYSNSTFPEYRLADSATSIWSGASSRFSAGEAWVTRYVHDGNGIVLSFLDG